MNDVLMRFALILMVFGGSAATAQESCIEPFRPDAEYLADGGFDAQEMRDFFRTYFSEVEDYLNCLNHSSSRIRQEATAAAQDYNRVLNQHPVEAGQSSEPESVPRVELSETGTLFLDYQAEWLK